jgi:hypothetical protein
MPSRELTQLWTQIEANLRQARAALPPEPECDPAIREYQDFLGLNELELACDSLEAYADAHAVPGEFWRALRDASLKMQLPDRAARYDDRAACSTRPGHDF